MQLQAVTSCTIYSTIYWGQIAMIRSHWRAEEDVGGGGIVVWPNCSDGAHVSRGEDPDVNPTSEV